MHKDASYDGSVGGAGEGGGWEEGKLLTEEEILYELYGKKGWRYNRFFVTFLASLPIFVGILATTLYLPAFTTIRDELGIDRPLSLFASSLPLCVFVENFSIFNGMFQN